MRLSALLRDVPVIKLIHSGYGRTVIMQEIEVSRIVADSREVKPGDCFVAIKGTEADGHKFVLSAVEKKAAVIVVQDDNCIPDQILHHTSIAKVLVKDTRIAFGIMSSNFFSRPADQLTMIGVTGTNGKTTISTVIADLMDRSDAPCGLIGTIEYRFKELVTPATHTTPDPFQLHMTLSRMLSLGATAVCMEVSSHSLDQERVVGIPFKIGIFSNLTQDHLDYHKTMDEYKRAKQKLFSGLSSSSISIVNADDPVSGEMIKDTASSILTYGYQKPADIFAENIDMSLQGLSFDIRWQGSTYKISSSLTGRFNVSNLLAAFGCMLTCGHSPEKIASLIQDVNPVKGRFQNIQLSGNRTVVIDYAHTPDALEQCLTTVKEIILRQGKRGKVITVFGAGGDRDRSKRPLMGKIVSELSDTCFVTSDNPRTEDPKRIIDDIMQGIKKPERVRSELDRREAILTALREAQEYDVVVIAGKGHEEYQIIGKDRLHFSDKNVVEDFIAMEK